jgi:hypothetical protein
LFGQAPAGTGYRSFTSALLSFLAQCAQQKIASSVSMPWPRIRHPQCAHCGANWTAAHSMLSKFSLWPSGHVTVKALS